MGKAVWRVWHDCGMELENGGVGKDGIGQVCIFTFAACAVDEGCFLHRDQQKCASGDDGDAGRAAREAQEDKRRCFRR